MTNEKEEVMFEWHVQNYYTSGGENSTDTMTSWAYRKGVINCVGDAASVAMENGESSYAKAGEGEGTTSNMFKRLTPSDVEATPVTWVLCELQLDKQALQ